MEDTFVNVIGGTYSCAGGTGGSRCAATSPTAVLVGMPVTGGKGGDLSRWKRRASLSRAINRARFFVFVDQAGSSTLLFLCAVMESVEPSREEVEAEDWYGFFRVRSSGLGSVSV